MFKSLAVFVFGLLFASLLGSVDVGFDIELSFEKQSVDQFLAGSEPVAQNCIPKGGDCTFYPCCPGSYCREHGGGSDKTCR